jgi:uncharacterized membrane protein HdeD (DUF308 family)
LRSPRLWPTACSRPAPESVLVKLAEAEHRAVIVVPNRRKEIKHEWLLILSGVLSVLFGVAMLISPGAGALAVIWLIGAYAIAFGVLLLSLDPSVVRQ